MKEKIDEESEPRGKRMLNLRQRFLAWADGAKPLHLFGTGVLSGWVVGVIWLNSVSWFTARQDAWTDVENAEVMPDLEVGRVESQIWASRLFAGPDQYPPEEFAAYGILAFRSAATPDTEERYVAICEGFVATLASATELMNTRGVPLAEQMGTVWPLYDAGFANVLNVTYRDVLQAHCGDIVARIDLITSGQAIANAEAANDGESLDDRGPYLIAWSPATAVGQPEVPVLISDLSGVTTAEQATDRFLDWADDIVQNPDLWRDGWDLERLRTTLRRWADKYGPGILRGVNLGDG